MSSERPVATARRVSRLRLGDSGRRSPRVEAYTYIRDRILSLDPQASVFLNEVELATELGVSRTPVREALLQLEGESLLKLIPNKGAYVPALAPAEATGLMEVRELLEVHSASRAIQAKESLSRLLSDALAAQEELLKSGPADLTDGNGETVQALIEADMHFHRLLVQAAGNKVIDELYDSLRIRQIRLSLSTTFGRAEQNPFERAIVEHSRIARALERGDLDALIDEVRAHCRTTLMANLGTLYATAPDEGLRL